MHAARGQLTRASHFSLRIPLQQGLAEGAAHDRAARVDGLAGTSLGGSQAGVDLDQVDGDEVAGLVNRLADVVALAQGQTTTDGGAGGSSPGRVEGVNVEGQVDGGVGTDVGKGHLDDAANTVAADNVLVIVLKTSRKGKTYRSTSNMLKALTPFSRRIFFSPTSTSRRPM